MSSKKLDHKLVAFEQRDNDEVKYIARKYNIPLAVVKQVIKYNGKKGKPARSRVKIYALLRILGYVIPTRCKKADHAENKKAAKVK